MRKISVSKYFGSRQLRPENLKPLRAGLVRQLECLRVKQGSLKTAEAAGESEVLFHPIVAASKANTWLREN